MLRKLKDLDQCAVNAKDGDVGCVTGFMLDDQRWAVRYLVVRTGDHFAERRVLISPVSFGDVDWSSRRISLEVARSRIRQSPSVNTDGPISRQHERELYRHYGYAPYWGHAGLWGTGAHPSRLATPILFESSNDHADELGSVRLRSASELCGHLVQGKDVLIGRIDDFIVDDATWEVRYLVVDANPLWPGRKLLVAPRWAYRISWADAKLYVDLSRERLEGSPRWDPSKSVTRSYETRLYDHYDHPQYWDNTDQPFGSLPLRHSVSYVA